MESRQLFAYLREETAKDLGALPNDNLEPLLQEVFKYLDHYAALAEMIQKEIHKRAPQPIDPLWDEVIGLGDGIELIDPRRN